MTPATCKKLLIPQFILTVILIQASSFTILAWGYWASFPDHFLLASIMIGTELFHYYLLYTVLTHKLVSIKTVIIFQISELLLVIPFVVFLIMIMAKDWPITWIHLYVVIIQVSQPTVRLVIYNHMKQISL